MSEPAGRIDLNPDQIGELGELMLAHREAIGFNPRDPACHYGNLVSTYLAHFCLAAVAESQMSNPVFADIFASMEVMRRRVMQGFEEYFGGVPAAEDILRELSRVATVSPAAADAIHRDVAWLTDTQGK